MIRSVCVLAIIGVMGCSGDQFGGAPDSGEDADDADAHYGIKFDGGDADSLPDSFADAEASDGGDGDVVTPPTSYRVFYTSKNYASNFGGYVAADAACSAAATSAGLGGKWMAWLSVSYSTVGSRLLHSTVPYKLLDGTTIALNWTQLTSGSILHAIDHDEFNTTTDAGGFYVYAATGTMADGTGVSAGATCEDWTSVDGTGTYNGLSGIIHSAAQQWTAGGYANCGADGPYHFYCLEQ